jgi:ankyrin repeat protein
MDMSRLYGCFLTLELTSMPKVECTGMHGNALQAASEEGHVPVVKLLLERGADPNAEGQLFNSKTEEYFDSNPLHEAAEGGHTQVVMLLLENGADMTMEGG